MKTYKDIPQGKIYDRLNFHEIINTQQVIYNFIREKVERKLNLPVIDMSDNEFANMEIPKEWVN